MAASRGTMLLRRVASSLPGLALLPRLFWAQAAPAASLLRLQRPVLRVFSTEMDPTTSAEPVTFDTESRFKEKPWEYLETEEYIERYGDKPIWFGYRRNHKGPIPPQKTRKTCIRGKKIVGNPCPICRDQKLHVDYRTCPVCMIPSPLPLPWLYDPLFPLCPDSVIPTSFLRLALPVWSLPSPALCETWCPPAARCPLYGASLFPPGPAPAAHSSTSASLPPAECEAPRAVHLLPHRHHLPSHTHRRLHEAA
ncbi:small ribosomal subunit protein mS40 isoform X2 [Lepidochelys kempii]|uniref:small ribosomal subunit protein mS40 isoform X2 n=1 Tax=Lepidochelys kempii TaxID=8472 RepID=UPI003C6FE630